MPIHSESDKFTVSVLACLEANVGLLILPGQQRLWQAHERYTIFDQPDDEKCFLF